MDFRGIYRTLIRLYPKDYQFRFASEMESTFQAALDDHRDCGTRIFARFVLVELIDVVSTAGGEWIDKLRTDASVRSRHLPDLRMMRVPWLPRESRHPAVRRIPCSWDTTR
jgi:hypothetical protein